MNYFAYMTRGRSKIVSDKNTIFIEEGDVFFIPKDLSYQSFWYGEGKIDFLSLGFLNPGVSEWENFDLQIISCEDEIKEKVMTVPAKGDYVTCDILSKFYECVRELLPLMTYEQSGRGEIIIHTAKDYIYYHPECSVSDMAKACAISEAYLYLVFKKSAGITPNELKQKVLCKKASELLITTDKSVEEISDMMNFSSSSYFRKIFKKHIGKTPREVRKNAFL